MKVLVDLHHSELFMSLYLLFVERLGWDMYVPMGMAWYEKGYWGLAPGDNLAVAKQFLVTPEIPVFSLRPRYPKLNYAYLGAIDSGAIKFDIIVASVPTSFSCFEKLIRDYGMISKLIFQAGNNFYHGSSTLATVGNLMSSATEIYQRMQAPNKVFYHQEFDLNIFSRKRSCNPKSVTNLQHYMSHPELFLELERALRGWEFKSYGNGNRNDALIALTDVSRAIQDAGFVFHVKDAGDGYGHTLHNSFACGTPLITNSKYMRSNDGIPYTGAMLYTPETIIDIEYMTISQIADELKCRADNYDYYSKKVYEKFKEVVDFDKEFVEVKAFLERLI